jgi:hypothetical protein
MKNRAQRKSTRRTTVAPCMPAGPAGASHEVFLSFRPGVGDVIH